MAIRYEKIEKTKNSKPFLVIKLKKIVIRVPLLEQKGNSLVYKLGLSQ